MNGSMLAMLTKKYNDSGLLGLFLAVIRRLRLFEYFVVFYFYRVPLEILEKDVKKQSNILVKIINSDEGLEHLLKVKNKRDIFQARLDNGIFATLIYYDGAPVGYVWGQLHSPHYEERYGFLVELRQDDVYDFDSYIDPAYRGLGLRKYLLNEFIRFAREEHGKRNMTAIIEKDNLNSVKIHEGMGYKRVNLQLALNVFSRDFQFVLRKYTNPVFS